MLNEQRFFLFGQIQTSQTGGQLYSVTLPYVNFCITQYSFRSINVNSHVALWITFVFLKHGPSPASFREGMVVSIA